MAGSFPISTPVRSSTCLPEPQGAVTYLSAMIVPDSTVAADDELDQDEPPILGSWRNMYLVVLVLHLCLLIAFYLISRAYTV